MRAKFAIITDIHFGPAKYDTVEHLAVEKKLPQIVSETVKKINEEADIEFVIHLGDLVQERATDSSREEDLKNAEIVCGLLSELKRPLHHVVGNHDRVNLNFEDLQNIFNGPLYYSFESGDFHYIVLQCESPGHFDVHLVEGELEWLEQTLSSTSKPTIIFMHQLLVEYPLEGTSCEGIPGCAYVRNMDEIKAVLLKFDHVIAVFNGHMHHNFFKVEDSIAYCTVQALTEPIPKIAKTHEAYAIVEITDGQLSIDIRGHEPKQYSSPLNHTVRSGGW